MMELLMPRFSMPIASATAVTMLLLAAPSSAEASDGPTTSDEVRQEVSEAMDAIADYSAQQKDQALTEAREALDQIDAEIGRQEQVLRENWEDMSESARAAASERLADLRAARNELGERYGALSTGTQEAWDELNSGFSDAWQAFSDAWGDSETDEQSN